MRRLAVFASGNGTNFEAIARACRQGVLAAEVVLLVCDRPGARVIGRAEEFGIPTFVTGAPDAGHPTKDTVTIEMRDPAFTLQAMGVRTAAEGVKGYYPAFDLTPPHLISGIVTDRGVFSPFDLQRYFSSGGMGEYEMVV